MDTFELSEVSSKDIIFELSKVSSKGCPFDKFNDNLKRIIADYVCIGSAKILFDVNRTVSSEEFSNFIIYLYLESPDFDPELKLQLHDNITLLLANVAYFTCPDDVKRVPELTDYSQLMQVPIWKWPILKLPEDTTYNYENPLRFALRTKSIIHRDNIQYFNTIIHTNPDVKFYIEFMNQMHELLITGNYAIVVRSMILNALESLHKSYNKDFESFIERVSNYIIPSKILDYVELFSWVRDKIPVVTWAKIIDSLLNNCDRVIKGHRQVRPDNNYILQKLSTNLDDYLDYVSASIKFACRIEKRKELQLANFIRLARW